MYNEANLYALYDKFLVAVSTEQSLKEHSSKLYIIIIIIMWNTPTRGAIVCKYKNQINIL